MTQLTLQPAQLLFTSDGIPYSALFDDVYHSTDGGLAQAEAVFLRGNRLPQRWQQRPLFSICETGFGLGLSFLTTWRAWLDDPERSERLHFTSCELHPFRAIDLAQLYRQLLQNHPTLLPLAEQLLTQWPTLLPGSHRLEFESGRVVLTLLFGDARHSLPKLGGRFNAFYLDGFSPAKNPQLWQNVLFKQFARLAHSEATLASYTVAGEVRRGLEQVGFVLEKRPGFGRKRHMLCGRFRAPRPLPAQLKQKHAVVIGAGMAGAAIAERLCSRGWQVTLLERRDRVAQEASGNHAGAYRPILSQDDNLQARLARACFLYGLRRFQQLPGLRWQRCGALQLARNAEEEARFRNLPTQLGLPDDYVHYLDQAASSAQAGVPLASGGLWFPQGAWVKPVSLVEQLLAQCGERLNIRFNCQIDHMHWQAEQDSVHGCWQLLSGGEPVCSAEVVILANAADAQRFAPSLAIGNDQRTVSLLPAEAMGTVKAVVCRGGYLTPAHDGWAALGSTPLPLQQDDLSQAHLANLQLLNGMLAQPNLAKLPQQPDRIRQCARPNTLDRMPIAGQLIDEARFQSKHAGSLHLAVRKPRLYALTGFGARGLVWAPLLAELLASQICGEPLPLERDLVLAIDPGRFLSRQCSHVGEQESD